MRTLKKYLKYFLLITVLFIITGCTNIRDLTNDDLINASLNEKKLSSNTFLEGYKLYLPEDMTMIGDLNGNDILYSHNDKYYLYVDLISYYNKKENSYKINDNNYEYSNEFNFKNKNGYVLVSKSKGGYLVEVMYNYAKVEVVTNDVKRAIVNSIVILKSINYNYKIVDSMIGSNALVYDSEVFSLLGPAKNKDSFLQYVEEYGVYDEEDSEKDEDVIEMESSD